MEESIDRVLMGPERKSRRMTAEEKKLAAYHEQATLWWDIYLKTWNLCARYPLFPEVWLVDIPNLCRKIKNTSHCHNLMDDLAMFMGGRAAEELVFNEISTGASSDIKQATDFARRMVTNWGMSKELGPRTFGQKEEMVFLGREIAEQRDYGETIADKIDAEVGRIIREAYENAINLLRDNRPKLEQLANALLEKETLEGDELDKVFNQPPESNVLPAKPSDSEHPDAKDKQAKKTDKKKPANNLPEMGQLNQSPAAG